MKWSGCSGWDFLQLWEWGNVVHVEAFRDWWILDGADKGRTHKRVRTRWINVWRQEKRVCMDSGEKWVTSTFYSFKYCFSLSPQWEIGDVSLLTHQSIKIGQLRSILSLFLFLLLLQVPWRWLPHLQLLAFWYAVSFSKILLLCLD